MSRSGMATALKQVQPVLAFAAAHLDEDLSLTALADRSGLSAFHLHRVFSAAAGETPKRFTLRLRLARAALLLLTRNDSVLNIALSCAFQSHEALCRAFRRRFGMSPDIGRADSEAIQVLRGKRNTRRWLTRVGPCIRLFHSQRSHIDNAMDYSITTKELPPRPVLVVRRQVKPSEIGATLAEVLGRIFQYAQREGAALAGPPLARYLEWGPGLITIEARHADRGVSPRRRRCRGRYPAGRPGSDDDAHGPIR